LRGHTDPVTAVDFSPDSNWLATGARNGEVNLWRVNEDLPEAEPVSFPASLYFRVANDGSGFGRISQPGLSNGVPLPFTAEVWTATPLQRALTVPLLEGPPRSGMVLAGCRGLVLGGYDGSIRVLGPAVGVEIVVTNAHKGEVYLMDASLDGSTLATKAVDEEQVRIWRLPHLERISELHQAKHVHRIKLSDDGKLLAGFTGPGDMGVWKIPSLEGPPMWRACAPMQIPTECAFSADSRLLAAAIPNGELFIWDLSTRKRMVLPRTLAYYRSLAFSPDGSRLAATSDKEAKLFDTATGQEVFSFNQPGLQLAFTRDGQKLLAVNNKAAFVLDARPLAELQFGWLKEKPSQEAPPYLGPDPDYPKPDRKEGARD
jgi:WD40 repeat protein